MWFPRAYRGCLLGVLLIIGLLVAGVYHLVMIPYHWYEQQVVNQPIREQMCRVVDQIEGKWPSHVLIRTSGGSEAEKIAMTGITHEEFSSSWLQSDFHYHKKPQYDSDMLFEFAGIPIVEDIPKVRLWWDPTKKATRVEYTHGVKVEGLIIENLRLGSHIRDSYSPTSGISYSKWRQRINRRYPKEYYRIIGRFWRWTWSDRRNARINHVFYLKGQYSVSGADIRGRRLEHHSSKMLLEDLYCRLSPDGRWVAFSTPGPSWDLPNMLWVAPVSKEPVYPEPIAVFFNSVNRTHFWWSRDSSKILYESLGSLGSSSSFARSQRIHPEDGDYGHNPGLKTIRYIDWDPSKYRPLGEGTLDTLNFSYPFEGKGY